MIGPAVVRIQPSTVYRVERVLPAEGEIVAQVGDIVQPGTPIARVLLPSPPANVSAAELLGVQPRDLAPYLVRQVGDQVQAGEVIARKKATLLGSKRECVSPIDGTIEFISYDDGQITIRQTAKPSDVLAEAVGRVTAVAPRKSITVETGAAVIQGALGVGGEVYGQLKVVVGRPDQLISTSRLDRSCRGCVLVGGGIEHEGVLARAAAVGATGLILGSVKAFGHERWQTLGRAFSPTVVLTEGFGPSGKVGIFPPAFDILSRSQGKRAWLRPSLAGRPEIVILLPDEPLSKVTDPPVLAVGCRVRVARAPHFGSSGRVVALPPYPRELESGRRSPVAEVETDDGRRIVAPLANLELIG